MCVCIHIYIYIYIYIYIFAHARKDGGRYAQSPYYHCPYQDSLTQTFREIPYGPGSSTP